MVFSSLSGDLIWILFRAENEPGRESVKERFRKGSAKLEQMAGTNFLIAVGSPASGWKGVPESCREAERLLDYGLVLPFDSVLVSAGRRPNFSPERLERLGIRCTGGKIQVDSFLRTTAPGIYAIGDIVPGAMLAHKASAEGFVRLLADERTGEVLGAQLVCGHASELIGQIAAAMQAEACVEDLADLISPHPSVGECIMEAAAGLLGKGIHSGA